MKHITRIRFSSMRVELEDDRGYQVQMPIGWYSGRQLDDIIAHMRQAQ